MFESSITFNRSEHSASISYPGQYLFVVDSIIGIKWLSKVLIDGGNSLNIKYLEMLGAMGIDCSCVRPARAYF